MSSVLYTMTADQGRLDDEPLQLLIGPWRQAMGSLTPVGPGLAAPAGTHRIGTAAR